MSVDVRIRRLIAWALLVAIAGLAVWSWSRGGLVAVLLSLGDNEASLDALRTAIFEWGPLAPAVYVAAVVIEVLVAPIPGTLLYAPAGALFGGFYGGVLSLLGNTIGAMVACLIAAGLGEEAVSRKLAGTAVARRVSAIRANAFWVVLLLRCNPLTSSDLVSYAAGAIGIPAWKVGAATFIGMAPLCFAQAYLAQQIFDVLPGAMYVVAAVGVVYVGFVIYWLMRPAR